MLSAPQGAMFYAEATKDLDQQVMFSGPVVDGSVQLVQEGDQPPTHIRVCVALDPERVAQLSAASVKWDEGGKVAGFEELPEGAEPRFYLTKVSWASFGMLYVALCFVMLLLYCLLLYCHFESIAVVLSF